MSYGLALQLADEWEQKVRQYAKDHDDPLSGAVVMIEYDALKSGAPASGMWNKRDVANKACEILADRIGLKFKATITRKLI